MPETLDSDVRCLLFDEGRLRRFLLCLTDQRRKTAKLEAIWSAFASVYDDIPLGREGRVWLLAVLEELDASEQIILPVRNGRQWDRTSDIQLPTKITLCTDGQKEASSEWRSYAWHPRLQWVLQRKYLAQSHFDFLQRVNRGLVEGWFGQVEALKYRSLQLTGDEKRLNKLCECRLFGPGRLSLDLLACETEILPLAYERTADRPTMLLFENAAPFMTARQIVSEISRPLFGWIAYGAGKQMVKSIRFLSTIEPKIEAVHYVGDLDAEGIQLLADCKRLSTDVKILPATMFHRAMIAAADELGAPDGWPMTENQPRQVGDAVLQVLDASVRGKCSELIALGHRIPEEALSRRIMASLAGC